MIMKRVFCILLSFLCVCHMTFGIAAAVTETDVDYRVGSGDVSQDGMIQALDALLVLKYCVGKIDLTPEQIAAADCSYAYYKTEDHKGIDGKDALLILQYVCHTGPFKHTFPS